MEYVLILSFGLVAGTVGGIVGFGSSIILMPILVIVFGPLQAVPVMAIAAILANFARVAVWWSEVDWRTCFAYVATAMPFAALGAGTLLVLPARVLEAGLGGFCLSMIAFRRLSSPQRWKLRRTHLALIGVPFGYITGIAVSTGPLTAPLFLGAGLVKGAFI